MAEFCAKCGAPIREGMSFCSSCGAMLGAPPAPPAQAPAVPAAPVAAASPALAGAGAPVATSGSEVLRVFLIVSLVLCLLITLGIWSCLGLLGVGSCGSILYLAKRSQIQQQERAQRAKRLQEQARTASPRRLRTPGARTQPAPPAGPAVDTGVAVYPGATPWGGGSQMNMGTTSLKSQEYLTDDPVDKVLAFYKDKLGANAMVTQSGGGAVVQLVGANGQTTVSIKPDANTGKTRISINRIGK